MGVRSHSSVAFCEILLPLSFDYKTGEWWCGWN